MLTLEEAFFLVHSLQALLVFRWGSEEQELTCEVLCTIKDPHFCIALSSGPMQRQEQQCVEVLETACLFLPIAMTVEVLNRPCGQHAGSCNPSFPVHIPPSTTSAARCVAMSRGACV
jgi:hypothetical protein